jgi:hypothetical protein
MKVLIQCAGSKIEEASTLIRNGQEIKFVARPTLGSDQCCPWDNIDGNNSPTWIDCLRSFNDNAQQGLPPGVTWGQGVPTQAIHLYSDAIYERIADAVGAENVYILSAGFGLVRGTDVIPKYNITFSNANKVLLNARITSRRRIPLGTLRNEIGGADQIHLFLTPNYISYFLGANPTFNTNRLSLHWRAGQTVPDGLEQVAIQQHVIAKRTNWQYIAADRFIDALA